jgi:hypothetical protein
VLVIVAVGAVPDDNVIAELVALQAVPLLTTTVYDPAAAAVYVEAVAPLMFVPFNFH